MRVMAAELTQRLLPLIRGELEDATAFKQLVICTSKDQCASMRRLARRMALRLQFAARKLHDTGDGTAAAARALSVRSDSCDVHMQPIL